MSNNINNIRGMNDLPPAECQRWQKVETSIQTTLNSFGYQQMRVPIVEKTELFNRCIGNATDIVSKEMYTFTDRSDDSISLRPEGTAGCMRSIIQQGQLNQVQRLWYYGPMFRYERPQKGRLRQFHQFGVEALGIREPDVDAEIIALGNAIINKLGISPFIQLHINTLGTLESRYKHRQALQHFLRQHVDQLDEFSRQRIEKNPLRVYDSKDEQTQQVMQNAPLLWDHLSTEELERSHKLMTLLADLGIHAQLNKRLVRGLDYYSHSVFEWITDQLGAQSTVCGGGRYDALSKQLGAKTELPAIGFAMGMERLVLLIEKCNPSFFEALESLDVYLISEAQLRGYALRQADLLRERYPQLSIQCHCGTGSFKNQIKKADNYGTQFAFIIGEQEHQQQKITVKPLRTQQPQQLLSIDEIGSFLNEFNQAR